MWKQGGTKSLFFFSCDKDLSAQSLNAAIVLCLHLCCERKPWQQLGTWICEVCEPSWEREFRWGECLAVCLWYCLCSSVQHVYTRHSCITTRPRAEKLTCTFVSLDVHASVFMYIWEWEDCVLVCVCICVCVCVCVYCRPRLKGGMGGPCSVTSVCPASSVSKSISRSSQLSEGWFLLFSLQEERLLWKQLGLQQSWPWIQLGDLRREKVGGSIGRTLDCHWPSG